MVGNTTAPKPLNVAIVGAGIVGLTAAAALRNQGHNVEIFEQAAFSKEAGAGLQVPPNAVKVLKTLGFKSENARSVYIKGLLIHPSSHVSPPVFRFESHDPEMISYSVHRVDFHDELRRIATSDDPQLVGKPAKLHLSRQVKSCDPENAIITFADGSTHQADLILGADGWKSVVRTAVVGHEVHAVGLSPPRAIFRWFTPTSILDTNPDAGWYSDVLSHGHSIVGPKEDAVIFYTCRDGELINCIAIHQDKRSEAERRAGVVTASIEDMEKQFPHFASEYKTLFKNASELRLWPLFQLPTLSRWHRGRAYILGDAAHAMFPFCGQGGAIGIENAATLGVLLPLGTTVEDLPARFAAHQALTKKRTDTVADWSTRQQFCETDEGVVHRIKGDDRLFMSRHKCLQVAHEYFAEHFGNAEDSDDEELEEHGFDEVAEAFRNICIDA